MIGNRRSSAASVYFAGNERGLDVLGDIPEMGRGCEQAHDEFKPSSIRPDRLYFGGSPAATGDSQIIANQR
jgi:plasmid stabilization system protein ParE